MVLVLCMAASFLLVVMCRAGALLERQRGTEVQGVWGEHPIKDQFAFGGLVDLDSSLFFSVPDFIQADDDGNARSNPNLDDGRLTTKMHGRSILNSESKSSYTPRTKGYK